MLGNNKKKNHEKGEADKVLRFAVIAVICLFFIGAVVIAVRMTNPRVDATTGVKKLTELEDANVQKIDNQIQELEDAEAEAAAAWKAKSAKEKLEGCIVLGDSTALGFRQNDILGKSQVKSKDGATVSDAEGSGLNELLTAVTGAETAPQKLFLCIGRGDVAVSDETADTFATNYKSIIEQLKAKLPDTKVYVCSIPEYRSLASAGSTSDTSSTTDTSSTSDASSTSDTSSKTDTSSTLDTSSKTDASSTSISSVSSVLDVTPYNDALKSLCKEEKVKYIDTTDLTDDSYYGEDGTTMTKAYYEACINKILEAAFRNYVIQ